jgi:hypothetical protein
MLLGAAVVVIVVVVVTTLGDPEPPPSGGATVERSRVHARAEDVRPLAAGDFVPSAEVRTIDGEIVDLAKRLRDHGALLVFYRRGW